MVVDYEQRRAALLWAVEALPKVHSGQWVKMRDVLYWLTSLAEAKPVSEGDYRDVTDEEFEAILVKMQPTIEQLRNDPEWSDEAFARRARAAMEPVEDILSQHQPSETPGRCSCGFWEVTQHADHQAAMLRGEGLLARTVDS